MDGTELPYPTIKYLPPPLPTAPVPMKFLEMQSGKLKLPTKHKKTDHYLGICRMSIFWIWTDMADIFGWTYLYLYFNRCVCICIWIKVEQNICIFIWKIQSFVFVFDKVYLTPALKQAV